MAGDGFTIIEMMEEAHGNMCTSTTRNHVRNWFGMAQWPSPECVNAVATVTEMYRNSFECINRIEIYRLHSENDVARRNFRKRWIDAFSDLEFFARSIFEVRKRKTSKKKTRTKRCWDIRSKWHEWRSRNDINNIAFSPHSFSWAAAADHDEWSSCIMRHMAILCRFIIHLLVAITWVSCHCPRSNDDGNSIAGSEWCRWIETHRFAISLFVFSTQKRNHLFFILT